MGRLRELLLDEETTRLASIDRRLDEVGQRLQVMGDASDREKRAREAISRQVEGLLDRAGTRDRFEDSVAEVLDTALSKAEANNHREMSRAVAPLVIDTVRSELRNSQDEMVEALYPITGRLVQAYVANAMRELAAKVNRGLGQNRLILRLRSLTTGRSMAELAMAATVDLELDELYLIRRGSGELISRWPHRSPLTNRDIHLGSILSAITDFANHAFETEGGHVRQFEADTFLVFLRASPKYILAAKCQGTPPPGFDTEFDKTFLDALERIDGDPEGLPERARASLDEMAETLKQRLQKIIVANKQAASGFGMLKFLLFLIAVPLFAWAAWWGFTTLEETRVRNAATSAIASMPDLKGYRTEVDVGYRGRTVSVTGLMPDDASRTELIRRIEAALPEGSRLTTTLAALPEQANPAPELERLRRRVVAVQVEAETVSLGRSLAEIRELIATTQSELGALAAQRRPDPSPARLSAARTALTGLDARVDGIRAEFEGLDKSTPGFTGPLLAEMRQAIADLNGALNALGLETLDLGAAAATPADSPAAFATDRAANTLTGGLERLSATVATLRNVPVIPPPKPPTALERLETWIEGNAVFFANGLEFRNPAEAREKLNTLAGLVKAAGRPIRVVGFTDDRGGLDRNDQLAQARAETVRRALVARDVPARQLIAVGRPGGRYDISPLVGENSPNRRVQFEMAFVGESD